MELEIVKTHMFGVKPMTLAFLPSLKWTWSAARTA